MQFDELRPGLMRIPVFLIVHLLEEVIPRFSPFILYILYGSRIINVPPILNRMGTATTSIYMAQDLTQDGMAKAFRDPVECIGRFIGGLRATTALLGILLMLVANHLRTLSRPWTLGKYERKIYAAPRIFAVT